MSLVIGFIEIVVRCKVLDHGSHKIGAKWNCVYYM